MPTTLTKNQGGSTWTIQQARALNASTAEIAAAIDAEALIAANAQATTATFVIGAEIGGNTINVGVTLKNSVGVAVSAIQTVTVFLSDASTGIGINGTAPSGGWAIGTNGTVIVAETAGKVSIIQSTAGGLFDLTITEASIDTWYLVVVLPNGRQAVSGAITFA